MYIFAGIAKLRNQILLSRPRCSCKKHMHLLICMYMSPERPFVGGACASRSYFVRGIRPFRLFCSSSRACSVVEYNGNVGSMHTLALGVVRERPASRS